MTQEQMCIAVAVGVKSVVTEDAMYFDVGLEYTAFGGDYTSEDLTKARAVLLDLADALQTAIAQRTH